MLRLILAICAIVTITATPQNPKDYKYQYMVRDDTTGDFKSQHEAREGDNVRGRYSVAEPNGDLRVVTYTANKDTGFNAQVEFQPGLPSLKALESLMRTPPRVFQKTEFPPLEIKVIPPKSEISDPEDEPETTTSTEDPDSTTVTMEPSKDKPCSTEEARAHIKPGEDRVQVEMEQVIHTEMRDPESVSIGVPYKVLPPEHVQVYMKPLYFKIPTNSMFIPHVAVNSETDPPTVFPSRVFLFPIAFQRKELSQFKQAVPDKINDEESVRASTPAWAFIVIPRIF